MPDFDRIVGGVSCRQVLVLLADFVDGQLEPVTLERVNAHLDDCDNCLKFGGEYGALVAQLREGRLRNSFDPAIHLRLVERMGREWVGKHD